MCFKKLTFKNLLACTLFVLTIGIFGLSLLPSTSFADGSGIVPPPPDSDTTSTYTSTSSTDTTQDTELSNWEIIILTASTLL